MGPFTAVVVIGLGFITAVWLWNPTIWKSRVVSYAIKDEYDYIVIGAGSAGSVLAARLAEDKDKTTLLLEAGGHFDEDPSLHIPGVWGTLLGSEYDWQYYTEPQTDIFKGIKSRRGLWPRGRVVGGSSVLNVMQYTRGSPFDFDEWATNGCTGWDYKSVLPYFLKSEDIQIEELKSSPYHSQGGPLAVSHNRPTHLTDVILTAGKELGYNITDYNGVDQEGFSKMQATIRQGVRSSTGLEFIGFIKKHNLDLSIHSFVTKVEIKAAVATGVYFIKDGRKHFVKARREVVLSAGVISSPQLLMLSGIGPKTDLERIGIAVKKDLPVGQFLKDHQIVIIPARTNVSLGFKTDDISDMFNRLLYDYFKAGPLTSPGSEGSAFLHIDKSKKGKSYPDIQMEFMKLLKYDFLGLSDDAAKTIFGHDPNAHGITSLVCPTRPKSVGSLHLRSSDPFDPPIINPGFFSNEHDIQTLIRGIRIWESLADTQVFKSVGVDIKQLKTSMCAEYEFRSDAYWECYIRHTGVTMYHHTSTCKMGPDGDPLAVVDPNLRVRGIQNFRVVDASVFPDVISGNTNAPTIMIAEKAADMIREIDTVKEFRKRIPS